MLQVPGDGVWAVVQTVAGQPLAKFDDHIDRGLRQPGRAGQRPARPRRKRCLALTAITSHQAADPALRDPVLAGHRRLAASLNNNGGDD